MLQTDSSADCKLAPRKIRSRLVVTLDPSKRQVYVGWISNTAHMAGSPAMYLNPGID